MLRSSYFQMLMRKSLISQKGFALTMNRPARPSAGQSGRLPGWHTLAHGTPADQVDTGGRL